MTAWPSSVPTYARPGTINEQPEDTRAKFTPDGGGPPMLRRRQSVNTTVVSYDTPPVATSVWDDLWDFYLDNSGSVFTRVHPDPGTSGTKNWQFESPPTRKHVIGDYWIISISLRMRP